MVDDLMFFEIYYHVIVVMIYIIFIVGISSVRDEIGIAHIIVFILLSIFNIAATSLISPYEKDNDVNLILYILKLLLVLLLFFIIYNIITLVPENIAFFIPMSLYLLYQIIQTIIGLVNS